MSAKEVVVLLDREAAADVLALLTAYDYNNAHSFTASCGKAIQPLRDVLDHEECAEADARYVEFAEAVA